MSLVRPLSSAATVAHAVRATCRRQPDALALVGDRELTYSGLAEAIARAAGVLREAGVVPGDVVALCAARSWHQLVATLAVLDVGAAVAPFDLRQVPAITRSAVADLRPALVLAESEGFEVLPDAMPLADLERPGDATPDARCAAEPDGLAYVLHTSGSTGRPKPVGVPHSALVNRFRWGQSVYPIGCGDAVLYAGSLSFDISFWTAFAPLCFGATTVVAPAETDGAPARLADVMRTRAVSAAHFVPTLLREFLADGDPDALRGLRYLFVGGERLPVALALDALHVTSARVFNQYGPTETCIDVLTKEITPSDLTGSTVPIGEPVDGVRVDVVDEDGVVVGEGESGELVIAGRCLAWGRGGSAETAAAFVPDPAGPPGSRRYRTGDRARRRPDGVLEFLGRADDQVKIRGVRLEPSQVDEALRGHPGVADAVTVVVTGDVPRLVAHVVLTDAEPADAELREHLADRVVSAAMPEAFVFHTALPRLPSGKVDRAGLAALPVATPATTGFEGGRPVGETEEHIAAIWAGLLGRERLGRDADFLRLGGQSLLVMRMVAIVRGRFGVRVPVRGVFAAPTVARFAAMVDELGGTATARERRTGTEAQGRA